MPTEGSGRLHAKDRIRRLITMQPPPCQRVSGASDDTRSLTDSLHVVYCSRNRSDPNTTATHRSYVTLQDVWRYHMLWASCLQIAYLEPTLQTVAVILAAVYEYPHIASMTKRPCALKGRFFASGNNSAGRGKGHDAGRTRGSHGDLAIRKH